MDRNAKPQEAEGTDGEEAGVAWLWRRGTTGGGRNLVAGPEAGEGGGTFPYDHSYPNAVIVFLSHESYTSAMTLPLLFIEYERQMTLNPRKAANADTLSKLY